MRHARGIAVTLILYAVSALIALGLVGWFVNSWTKGQEARAEAAELRAAAAAVTASLTAAREEVDTLRSDFAGIVSGYQEDIRHATERASRNTGIVRTVVRSDPTLANGRLPASFVRNFNAARTGEADGGATAYDPARTDAAVLRLTPATDR